jgi:prevent-host-death family protein
LTIPFTAIQSCADVTCDQIDPKGAEEARNQLSDLLAAAERGHATVITSHGRPVAAIVPIDDSTGRRRQQPLRFSSSLLCRG